MKFGQTQNVSTGDKDRLPTSLRGLGRDRTFKLRRSIKLGRAVACGGGPCPFRFETDAGASLPLEACPYRTCAPGSPFLGFVDVYWNCGGHRKAGCAEGNPLGWIPARD